MRIILGLTKVGRARVGSRIFYGVRKVLRFNQQEGCYNLIMEENRLGSHSFDLLHI